MPNRSGWKWAATTLVVSLLFTLIVVQYSMTHGRLLTVPFFDDVTYFRDALSRLGHFYAGGFIYTASEYWHAPPHSPFSTLLAVISFGLLGVHDWALYVGNVVIVFTLLLFVGKQLATLRLWERICCVAVALTFPLAAQSVFEFRPDIPCGLLTAMGVALMMRHSPGRATLREKLAIGACFGGALVVKPPMVAFTLIIFGAALAMTTLADLLTDRKPFRLSTIIRNWWPYIIAAAVLAFPHYAIDGKAIAEYVYVTTFGATAHTAASHEPRVTQLVYHLTGKGGQAMLGNHLYLLIAIGFIGFAWAAITRRSALLVRGLCFFAVLLLSFAIPAVHIEKQMFFAVTFDLLLLFGAILVLREMLSADPAIQRDRNPARPVFALALLMTALLFAKFPDAWGAPRDLALTARSRLANQLSETLMASATESQPKVFFTTTGYINADVLGYLCLKAGDTRFEFNESPLIREPESFAKSFDAADFVIASESGNTEAFTHFASGLVQDETLAMLRSRPEFRQLAAFPSGNRRRYFVFGKNVPFYGWEEISGLGSLEGPYPEWKLPKIRWGVAPATRLAIQSSNGGRMRLSMECAAAVPDTTLIILLDGAEVGRNVFATGSVYATIEQPLDLSAGRHVLELRYSKWDEENPVMLRAVIYKKLQICPQ